MIGIAAQDVGGFIEVGLAALAKRILPMDQSS
jgi:hypothetical protein